jgi:hypothetical protein
MKANLALQHKGIREKTRCYSYSLKVGRKLCLFVGLNSLSFLGIAIKK